MQFSALSTAFRMAEQPDLYLTLSQIKGLTVVRDSTLQATCNQVFMRVASVLAQSLDEASPHQSLKSCFTLRAALDRYTNTNKNAAGSPIAKQVSALLDLVLLKAATEDKTAVLKVEGEASPPLTGVQLADCIITALKNLSRHFGVESDKNKLLPKRVFYTVQVQLVQFLADRIIGNESIKLLELRLEFFNSMLSWWEASAHKHAQIPDENSQHAKRLLANEIKNPTTHDFDTLVYPRDLLFIEKQTLFHLIGLATTELLFTRQVSALLNKGYEASYEQVTPTLRAVTFSPKEDDVAAFSLAELSLFLQTKKACAKIVSHGVTSSAKPIIKKLIAYKNEQGSNQEFFDLCIEMITINELFYKKELLRNEWPKYDCAGAALTYSEQRVYYSSESYLIRKRLKYLWRAGVAMHGSMHDPSNISTPDILQDCESLAIYYTEVLRKCSPRFMRDEDTTLYESLAKKITQFRNASRQKANKFSNYEQIAFENKMTGNEYDDWKHTTIEDYRSLLTLIGNVIDGIAMRTPYLVRKLSTTTPAVESKESFLRDIKLAVPAKPRIVKRKKPPASSRSPSPPTVEAPAAVALKVDAVAEVTESVAKLTLTPVKSEPESTVVIKKPPKQMKRQVAPIPQVRQIQAVQVQAVQIQAIQVQKVFYASRVIDWFCPPGSKRDPFINDPDYNKTLFTEAEKLWIRARHSFAQALDKYLPEGKPTTDKDVLKRYNAKQRIQLIGEITIDSPILSITKKGVFTYTIGKTKHIFHRWFTPMNSKEIIHPDAQKGWNILNEPQPADIPNEKDEAVASDGSSVESETDNLAVIVDPRNFARIRIARL